MAPAVFQTRDTPLTSWQPFLDDPRLLRVLLYIGKDYEVRFENAFSSLEMLSKIEKPQYLTDFDVTSDFVKLDLGDLVKDDEAESRHPNATTRRRLFEVYYWFYHARKRDSYWMPAGAFEELLQALKRLQKKTGPVRRLRLDNLNPEQAVRKVASAIGIKSASNLDFDQLRVELDRELEQDSLQLDRLDEFLSDPFAGVCADYDPELADQFMRWFEACPRIATRNSRFVERERKGKNDSRDRRDAINLAIAVNSVISRGSPRSLVLVTSTKIILDFANLEAWLEDEVRHIPEERHPHLSDFERREILENILQIMKKSPGYSDHIVHSLPIISPQNALIAELLGFFEDPNIAMQDLDVHTANLKKIVTFCRRAQAELRRSPESNFRSASRSAQVEQILEEFVPKFLGKSEYSSRSLSRLEQHQHTTDSIGRQITGVRGQFEIGSAEDSRTARSSEFLHVITNAFSNIESNVSRHIDYNFKTCVVDSWPAFISFRFEQKGLGDSSEVVLEGEAYPSDLRNDRLYSLRIPTSTYLKEFLKEVEIQLFSGQSPDLGDGFKSLSEDSSVWRNGILIFTGEEWLGTPLEESNEDQGIGFVELFKRSVNNTQVPQDLRGFPVLARPSVERVKVCVNGCEISFDCEVLRSELGRYVRILQNEFQIDLVAQSVVQFYPQFVSSDRIRHELIQGLKTIEQQLSLIEANSGDIPSELVGQVEINE
ncbi:hypothetical protein GC197_09800 [bacterium]|nr:hypothetical protein [bacterium]